jgi:uncharacterized protein YutE (UPF0331/DUF86 family)
MTYLVERLADLRKHVTHLRTLQPRVPDAASLERDLTLHNDVLFSLLMVCQLVIDIAGELSARQALSFADYTEAVRNLRHIPGFSDNLLDSLGRLPGFRNIVVHDYVGLDLNRAVQALHELDEIDDFIRIVAKMESGPPSGL